MRRVRFARSWRDLASYVLMAQFGVGYRMLGPSAGHGPVLVHLGISAGCAFATFVFSIGRSRQAWDQYEGLLKRKRSGCSKRPANGREAKNAPASPLRTALG